ncbi:hypothetical protein [Bacillus thuringiensis]|uniref:hypothetical protein n=1 Tax=Bacillus thuringiensis TaxID=1428 RepID=UPI0021E745C3|nr:hypothetical protein [Bacillus thuringiensis]
MQVNEIKDVFLTKSDLIAFTFGLSCCVFTLIGLVAIYISINTQHVIQKCREILWELIGMLQDETDFKTAREKIRKNYWMYSEILGKKDFSNIVVYSVIIILILAAYIWINLVAYLKKSVSLNTELTKIELYSWMGIIILGVFCIFLALLSNGKFVGRLDNPKNILNGNKITKASTISLVGLSMELILRVDGFEDKLFTNVRLNFPLPFRNFYISSVIVGFSHDRKDMEYICGFDVLKVGDKPLQFHSNYEGAKALWVKPGYGVDMVFPDLDNKDGNSEQNFNKEINLRNYPIIQPNFYIISNEGCIYLEFEEMNLSNFVDNDELYSEKVFRPIKVKESTEFMVKDGEVIKGEYI